MLVPFPELIIPPPSFFFLFPQRFFPCRGCYLVLFLTICCSSVLAIIVHVLPRSLFYIFGDYGECRSYNNQSLILQKKNNRLQRISILFNVWFLCWKNYNPSKYLAAQKDPTPLGNGVWELWFTNKLRPVFLFLINWLYILDCV